MKLITTLVMIYLTLGISFSQNIANYSLTSTASSYTYLASGATAVPGGTDDDEVGDLQIGFDFWYMGVRYTTFGVDANGWMKLGGGGIGGMQLRTILGTTVAANRPAIAPLWDDLAVSKRRKGKLQDKRNCSPNRTLTVEWKIMESGTGLLQTLMQFLFQAILFESTGGKLRFLYKNEGGMRFNAASASIGLSAVPTGKQQFC